jgi:hypothetical protein
LAVPNPTGSVSKTPAISPASTHIFFIIRSFQQAVLKNMNERNAQLQKQLDNIVREG